MTKKVKLLRLIVDLLGLSVGFVVSFFMIFITFGLVMVSNTIINGINIVISIITYILALFSSYYFCYRFLRIITKKDIAKYIYK